MPRVKIRREGGLLAAAIVTATAIMLPVGAPAQTLHLKAAFDRKATMSATGRAIRVGGPLVCTGGEFVRVEIAVSQRTTGAVADGRWSGRCTGAAGQRWTIRVAKARPGPQFRLGRAQACGLAVSRQGARVEGAFQWCARRDFRLLRS